VQFNGRNERRRGLWDRSRTLKVIEEDGLDSSKLRSNKLKKTDSIGQAT
jgi:hypothetical protein